jgi:hypothetical protein
MRIGFVTPQEKTAYCADNVTDRCCSGTPEGLGVSGGAVDSINGTTNSTTTLTGTNSTAPAATATVAANQSNGNDSSSNSSTPLIVGGIIGGLVLLGLIIGILTYLRKKRAAKGSIGAGYGGASGSAPSGKLMAGSSSPEVMRVIYDYVPNLFDEIHLYAGDQIEVKAKFDDGWAYGLNLTSKKEGSFPLACVESLSGLKGDSSVASSPSKNSNSNIRQRASSLYVAKQY